MSGERYTRVISRMSGVLCAFSFAAAYIAALRIYPPNAFLGYVPPSAKREIMSGVFIALAAFTAAREVMELALPVMRRAEALILPLPAVLCAAPLICLRFEIMSVTASCYAFCAALMFSVPLAAAVIYRERLCATDKRRAARKALYAAAGTLCALMLVLTAVLLIYSGFFSSPLAYLFISPVSCAAAAICIAAGGISARTISLFAASCAGLAYCVLYPYERLYQPLAVCQLALITVCAIFYISYAAKALAKRRAICYNKSKSQAVSGESEFALCPDSPCKIGGNSNMESKNKIISGLGIHHVALKVSDFERSFKFYTDLGMTPAASWGEGDGRAQMFDIGDGAILEMFAGGGDSLQACGKFQHIAFRCDDIDAAYEKALSVGARPHIAPKDVALDSKPEKMVLHIAFVLGPDDEQLEFFSVKSKG
ncbi:MAG: VOC family protein [Eubacteriales bacterium]